MEIRFTGDEPRAVYAALAELCTTLADGEIAAESFHDRLMSAVVSSSAPAAEEAALATEDEDAPPASLFAEPSATTARDTKGVVFNPEFCGQAKEPFNRTGKRAGQWKKRVGVDEAAYDAWYSAELSKAAPAPTEDATLAYDTAKVFATAPAPAPTPDAPKDGGALMVWVSKQQAAGLLTEAQVQAAWSSLGLAISDVFPANPNHLDNVAKLYARLSA